MPTCAWWRERTGAGLRHALRERGETLLGQPEFVDRMARRIASFDRSAVAVTKRLIGRRTRITESDLTEAKQVDLPNQ
jgi:hypothetical protein